MAYWDTSAIVALCGRGALFRLARDHVLSREAHAQALERFGVLRMHWQEVLPSEQLRALAESLPERFRLRAGDAFQLAAALVWSGERPRRRPFVCLEKRLGQAAASLGCIVEGRAS